MRLFRITSLKGLERESHNIYIQDNNQDIFVLERRKDTNKDINLITLAHNSIGFRIKGVAYIPASKL